MSYCVNCGVELEQSISQCPLCNTPVYNPLEKRDAVKVTPYPTKKGEVGVVKKTDQAILISVLILCTAIGCGLLNLLVYRGNYWSFYIIGICVVLWVFSIPAMLYQKMPFVLMILLDAIVVALYCAMVAYRYDGWDWYLVIAAPIIGMATVLIIAFGYLNHYISKSILFTAMVVVIGISLFCAWINLCIHYFTDGYFALTWSSIVLTCGGIIAVTLITIMRVSRLREEVRRRMHI